MLAYATRITRNTVAIAILFTYTPSLSATKILQKVQNIGPRLVTEYPIELLPMVPKQKIMCVALAVYKEARGENETAQSLVAKTIMHRTKKYNQSECQVIASPHQFPWASQISTKWHPQEADAWQQAQYVAFMSEFSTKYPEGNCQPLYFNTVLIKSHRRELKCSIHSGHQIYYDLREKTHVRH